jgi:hypothetical protein
LGNRSSIPGGNGGSETGNIGDQRRGLAQLSETDFLNPAENLCFTFKIPVDIGSNSAVHLKRNRKQKQ